MDTSSIFITGPGRCGTHFLAEVLKKSKYFNAYHTDDLGIIDHDAFFRYCNFNDLNVDHSEYFHFRKNLIEKSNSMSKIYAESNPYISCGVEELYNLFHSTIIIMHRNPIEIIRSFYVKGMYETPYVDMTSTSARGPSPNVKLYRELGRVVPVQDYPKWKDYPRVRKISWWYQSSMDNLYNQLKQIPGDKIIQIDLNLFNYQKLQLLFNFLNLECDVSDKVFSSLLVSKPGKMKTNRPNFEISDMEKKEIELKSKHIFDKFSQLSSKII